MIYIYTGTPGSGKSLHTAKDIYQCLLRETYVITNFGINNDYFEPKKNKKLKKKNKKLKPNKCKGQHIYINNFDLDPKFLTFFARGFFKRDKKGRIKEGQALLVIDECSILLGCRDWNVKSRNAWIIFFQQHRKFGYNIILVTQNQKMIDRQVRGLIEYEVLHRKLNNFKLFGKIFALFLGGSAFIAITKWNGMNVKISSETFSGRKYFDFYNSYEIF